MNTEKLKTLEQIRIAIESIEEARFSGNTSLKLHLQLEKMAVKLWNMEQALIKKKGIELTETLDKETKSLIRLIKQLKLDADSLKKMINKIENAVKLSSALTKILRIGIKVNFF